MRNFKSLQRVPIMMCATHLNPNKPSHYFTASTVRARERQTRAPKKGILRGLGRVSYPAHVTVYPYNGYIRSTNPIVQHVMSLTCTPARMRANQHTPKHAATQPLHDSNTHAHAPAPNDQISCQSMRRLDPTRRILLLIHTRGRSMLQVQILSCNVRSH